MYNNKNDVYSSCMWQVGNTYIFYQGLQMSLGAQSFASSGVKGFFGISRDFIHVQSHSLIPINFIGRLCPITVKILFNTDQSPNKIYMTCSSGSLLTHYTHLNWLSRANSCQTLAKLLKISSVVLLISILP